MHGGSPIRWLLGLSLGLAASAPAASARGAPPEGAPVIKVAVVIAGDPDPRLVEAAERVSAALRSNDGIVLPADEALRAALVGAPGPTDDGLSEARAARRRLGLGEATDRSALAQLGGLTGAVALAVVRPTPDPSVEVFDVDRGAYFEGTLDLIGADPQTVGRFVLRRAEAARAHVGESVATRPPPPAPPAEAVTPRAAAEAATADLGGAGTTRSGEAPETRRRAPFFRRNWPYFVAGALLAGAVTYIAVSQRQDQADPIVRIRPGGS